MNTRKQTANGTVELRVVPGTHHCGIDDTAVSLNYEIELGFTVDALDENGFLLDNTAFRGYFTALASVPVSLSCERLAERVAFDLVAMLGDRVQHLLYADVKLSPFPGVAVHFRAESPFTPVRSYSAVEDAKHLKPKSSPGGVFTVGAVLDNKNRRGWKLQ